MTPNEEEREEQTMHKLFAPLQDDAPPPDPAFLKQLREQASEAFAATSGLRPDVTSGLRPDAHQIETGANAMPQTLVPLHTTAIVKLPEQPKGRLHGRHTHWLAGGLAAAVLIAAAAAWWFLGNVPQTPLGDALAKTAQAETLHFRLVRDGQTADGRAKQHRLRMDQSPGLYELAEGAGAWAVNEREKTVKRLPRAYFQKSGNDYRIDLLGLVGVPAKEAKTLVALKPAEKTTRGGVDLLVYREQLKEANLRVEALVNAGTNLLQSLAAQTLKDGKWIAVAELTLISVNEPVKDETFLVTDTLTEDGRLGKVTDAQGVATLRPMQQERWSPAQANTPLRPGDWLRTDTRGPNAVAMRLLKQATITLGPGGLIEMLSPNQIRLISGEVEIVAPEFPNLQLLAPNNQLVTVIGKHLFKLENDKLLRVEKEPQWLKGFKGAIAGDAMGSLIANVDGRNEPLTVGYHKVTVDIRDQIARTVIEQSFVNHTDAVLEGNFYFPLPQDASISGFGMWIGNELVEADVVEKQRAREIYETILRDRRDPGLLEWSGGNIFKARVFPIFAHSEKRVKITYTQVLPLRGNTYRYSYALQSEMLKQKPLRQLDLDVRVHSALAIKNVRCETHTTRLQKTDNDARVEFTAQEYTPTRDFEVTVELAGRRPEVVLIPHRRGDDGYFLVQLSPPTTEGDWQRELIPDGAALDLLILADTSASMDQTQRTQQAQFLASLFASLTPKDKINLACCDVNADWAFAKPVAADAKNLNHMRDFLAKRASLGWTDLDKAFESAQKQIGPKTHVIYVGDGTVSTRDADAFDFGKRLRRLFEGKPGTLHAVSVGNAYESIALKAIAAVGGGSTRRIGADSGGDKVALELLRDIAQPGLRNLKVEFKGIRVARVYPETLPNLQPGMQHIILGRYLPEGRDQEGEIIVSGLQGDKPVRFSSKGSLKDAEQGNSFIPRLWARLHLDMLLEQGGSPAVRDDISALSEEYQIMTPYTSFLVLETDADRERFGVKRRFQMRDGERFFAEGRDKTDFALAQQQMKRAGTWRLGLRRQALAHFATLGRNPALLQPLLEEDFKTVRRRSGLADREWGSFAYKDSSGRDLAWRFDGADMPLSSTESGFIRNEEEARLGALDEFGGEEKAEREFDETKPSDPHEPFLEGEASPLFGAYEPRFARGPREHKGRTFATSGLDGYFASDVDGYEHGLEIYGRGYRRPYYPTRPEHWFTEVLPHLASVPRPEQPIKQRKSWSEDARKLAASLLRTDKLAKLAGGIELTTHVENFDIRWNELSGRSQRRDLYSPKAWLSRWHGDGSYTAIEWCDDKERGIFTPVFQLGRARASVPLDLRPNLHLADHSLVSMESSYAAYEAKVELGAPNRGWLILSHGQHEVRFLIDTGRHVVVRMEFFGSGKPAGSTTFDDFVEVAGCWWARKIESKDEQGRLQMRTALTIKDVAAGDFARAVAAELQNLGDVHFIRQPLPTVAEAKRALAAAKAGFAEHFVLMVHFASSQQWTRVFEHWQQAEKAAGDKPGLRWMRDVLYTHGRKQEELREDLLRAAKELVERWNADGKTAPASDFLYLAEHLQRQTQSWMSSVEALKLLDELRPIYAKQPPHVAGEKRWQQHRLQSLYGAGQTEAAQLLEKEIAERYPRDIHAQQRCANALLNRREFEAAYAYIAKILVPEARWTPYEEQSLREIHSRGLEQEGRFADLADYLAKYIDAKPDFENPYAMYLSALLRSGQDEKADKVAHGWMRDALVDAAVESPVLLRGRAALRHMLGRGPSMSPVRIDEKWLPLLEEAVLAFARHKDRLQLAEELMRDHLFRRTDQARRVRKQVGELLEKEIDKLTAEQIARYAAWAGENDPVFDKDYWKKLAAAVQARWAAEKDADHKDQVASVVVAILRREFTSGDAVVFLRRQLKEGTEHRRTGYVRQLFDALLAEPWSQPVEDEAFGLIAQVTDSQEPAEQTAAQAGALLRAVDQMIQNRIDKANSELKEPEKLTRTELRQKREEFLKQARTALSDRLSKEAARQPKALGSWIAAERIYLDVRLERNLKEAEKTSWDELKTRRAATPREMEEDPARRIEAILRERFVLTLAHLGMRRGAEAASVERLLKYADEQIAADKEAGRGKLFKYQLLLGLDRPADLRKQLDVWMREDDPTNFWRLALGYLNAELGHIGEAVKLFEGVEFSDELGPEAYRALANWYLVLNRKEGHDRALIRTYLTMDEYNVSRWLGQRIYPWRHAQQNPPSEVDKEILAAFAALFEKASHPRQHQHLLHDAYRSTRDFRLLAAMADAVVGHSAGKIYPFLEGMQPIIGDVRDEATVDELLAHAQKVRGRAKSAIDRRAIDLLEMMVLRRAAEIKNQPGPHIKGAVQALQRAFDREWTPGEHRYVASLLANLGTITAPELRKEQLDRIVQLYAVPKRGEYDRLVIGHSLAGLHWNYNRKNEAIDLLGAVIVEYRDANGGKLLNIFQTEFATLISYQEQMKRFAAGETLVLHELKATVNPQVGFWLKLRLFESYARALEQGGAVSLGEGAVLYRALEQRLREEMASHDMSYRDGLVSRLCQVYRTAHVRNIMSVAEDLRRFAFKEIHGLLAKQTSGHSNIRSQVSETVRELLGAHDAVLFVVEQIEREPAWFRLTGQDGWYQLGYRAARWRSEAEKLDQALEGRLLKIVLNELRDDLLSGRSRNREMYHHNHGYYWKDKEDDFVRVAEQVLTKVQNSGAAVQYVADYFYWGVQRYDRAIAVLFAAHQKKLLDEGGRAKLVDFLHRQSRYGESIPILEPLIVRSPKHMTYRALLMHAYFRTRQHEKLVALLKETDKLFRTPGLWVEPHIAALAGSTLDNELYKESVAYWNEVIPLHQRTAPNRGVGRGTLSHYYGQLGRAYAGLGKTPEAVDAASAAVVSWGSRHTERSRALESLRDVLRRAPDLDAYVVHLDKQASEAKHDYPIIRKAIGEVYAEKQQFQKAIAQFRIAVELQPNDAETHAALVAAHDKAGDPLGAIAQLKESVKLSRRDLKLYEDLGKRYEKERDATEAERAYTSLVEVMPLEAEGHAALAEVREKQGRLAEAAAEWEHVARLRALEPTGLLRLAGVQIKLRQFDEARETLKKLRGKTWPIRFEKLDEQIEKLDTELRKAKAQ